MLPRVSNLLSSGNKKAVNKLHEMSFLVCNLVIFPMIAGILIVNNDFVQFFLGQDFQDARYAIAIMVFRMFFIGWTNIMGIQILIPHNRNREFMLSTTIPAIFSVGLNLILIPPLGYIGASIVSVVTEGLVWLIQLYFTSDYLKEVKILPSMLKILLAAFLMYGALYFIKTFINFSSVVNVLICSVLGFLVYGGLVLILRILDFQELKSIIKK